MEETGRTSRPVAGGNALLDPVELVVGMQIGRAFGVATSGQRRLVGLGGFRGVGGFGGLCRSTLLLSLL
jgi:hypothetical protein